MKSCIILCLGIFYCLSSAKGQEVVKWQYKAKQISPDTYEVRLTAILDDGWHLYSQQQPEDAVATPTKINFASSPLVTLEGSTKEKGDLVHFKDDAAGIEANQYLNKVDFVQLIKLKDKVSVHLTGSIHFQTCTDEQCLPPVDTHFNITLNG